MEPIRATKHIPKKIEVTVVDVTQRPAPELKHLYKDQFKNESIDLFENALLSLGIIIPRKQINRLSKSFEEIGKKYYCMADTNEQLAF